MKIYVVGTNPDEWLGRSVSIDVGSIYLVNEAERTDDASELKLTVRKKPVRKAANALVAVKR